jgi:hypothetical protein
MGLKKIRTEMNGDTSRRIHRVEAKTASKKRRRRTDRKSAVDTD